MKLYSIGIIIMIAGIVFFGAFMILETSIMDERSNIRIAQSVMRNPENLSVQMYDYTLKITQSAKAAILPDGAGEEANLSVPRSMAHSLPISANRKEDPMDILEGGRVHSIGICYLLFRGEVVRYNYSLVDYLADNGEVTSMASRQELANRLGIGDYRGTSEQNQKILFYLLARSSKLFEKDCADYNYLKDSGSTILWSAT